MAAREKQIPISLKMSINTCRQFPIIAIIAAALFPALEVSVAAQDTVDFHYSPPEWQAAISDDPQKSLVDKSGDLLYHYHEGGRGREFDTRISVDGTPNLPRRVSIGFFKHAPWNLRKGMPR